ncbi:unnamed protein product [Urochloa humidicola]
MPWVADELREPPMASLASSTPRGGRHGAGQRWAVRGTTFPSLASGIGSGEGLGGGLQLELDVESRPRALHPSSWRRRPDPLALSPLQGGPYRREAGAARQRP